MKIRAFITHKKAEYFKDCQDRFSINPDTKSVAVSDGMSQSYQQKIWAEMLVNAYTTNTEWIPNQASVKAVAPQWFQKVNQFIQELRDANAPQWLIIMNNNALAQQKSAGATFCGIRFNGDEWSGYVLGDSCLIEIANNKIQKLYTSQTGDAFDNHPDYFDSNPLKNGKGDSLAIKGTLDQSTTIILVSDPFSDLLNEKQKLGNEEDFVKQLLAINNHDEFEKLVADWRDNYNMHNDDTTIIIIEHDDCDSFNVAYCDDLDALIADENQSIQKTNDDTSSAENHNEQKVSEEQQTPSITVVHTNEGKITEPKSELMIDSVDEFVQTGMRLYMEYVEKENSILYSFSDDDEYNIFRKTLMDLYILYKNK